MSRADMFVVEDRVVIAPLDLPFDPGDGKVVIENDVALGSDVAPRLGFEEVKPIGGLYVVDSSFNDPYGRISVAAELIP